MSFRIKSTRSSMMFHSEDSNSWNFRCPCCFTFRSDFVIQTGAWCTTLSWVNYFLVGAFKHDWIMFHNIWDNPSHWLIFFKMVKTTNQFLWGLNPWIVCRSQTSLGTIWDRSAASLLRPWRGAMSSSKGSDLVSFNVQLGCVIWLWIKKIRPSWPEILVMFSPCFFVFWEWPSLTYVFFLGGGMARCDAYPVMRVYPMVFGSKFRYPRRSSQQ